MELAVQRSPDNPPAAWLWRPSEQILGAKLQIRVGGKFIWPPQDVDVRKIQKAVFVAGGVGIKLVAILLKTDARTTDVCIAP